MNNKEELRRQLLEIRMQLALTKDESLKSQLKEEANLIHKAFAKCIYEEKLSEQRKGR